MKPAQTTGTILERLMATPPIVKLLLMGALCLILILLGYFIERRWQINQLNKAKRLEHSLMRNFESKQRYYAQLDHTAKQVIAMHAQFRTLLKTLPPKSKIDELLKNISKVGTTEGLKFVFFKPQPEKNRGFYVQMPIKIAVLGHYHQIARFISDLANLKQLVVVDDFKLSHINQKNNILTMHLTINVYRYYSRQKSAGKKLRGIS